jgi:hypothetical protein
VTATLVREDGREDVFALIDPQKADVPFSPPRQLV